MQIHLVNNMVPPYPNSNCALSGVCCFSRRHGRRRAMAAVFPGRRRARERSNQNTSFHSPRAAQPWQRGGNIPGQRTGAGERTLTRPTKPSLPCFPNPHRLRTALGFPRSPNRTSRAFPRTTSFPLPSPVWPGFLLSQPTEGKGGEGRLRCLRAVFRRTKAAEYVVLSQKNSGRLKHCAPRTFSTLSRANVQVSMCVTEYSPV